MTAITKIKGRIPMDTGYYYAPYIPILMKTQRSFEFKPETERKTVTVKFKPRTEETDTWVKFYDPADYYPGHLQFVSFSEIAKRMGINVTEILKNTDCIYCEQEKKSKSDFTITQL